MVRIIFVYGRNFANLDRFFGVMSRIRWTIPLPEYRDKVTPPMCFVPSGFIGTSVNARQIAGLAVRFKSETALATETLRR